MKNEMIEAAMLHARLMIVERMKPKCSPPLPMEEIRAATAPRIEIPSAGPKSRPAIHRILLPRNRFR
jgi:hypothetical protein